MSFDVTKLPDYIDQTKNKQLLVNSLRAAKTIDFCSANGQLYTGIKHKETLNIMNNDVNLQANDGCGRSANGKTSFEQVEIEVTPLKDELSLCPKDLETKWTNAELTEGQNYSTSAFANDIIADRGRQVARKIEKLLWNGKKSNGDLLDGFIAKMPASTELQAGANLIEKLQKTVLTISEDVKGEEDFAILISDTDYERIGIELAGRNIYKDVDDSKLFGTKYELVAFPDIPKGSFIFARKRSFVAGTDLVSDLNSADMIWSVETRQLYIDFLLSVGVSIAFKDEVFYFVEEA